MDQHKVKELWEKNANLWIQASESSADEWRNIMNTPAFLSILPNISKQEGLDIGCGDGYNSRLIANRCLKLTAIDFCEAFIEHNKAAINPTNLIFELANATKLPYKDKSFDFVTSLLALMDIAKVNLAFQEVSRVLKKTGFFQFSILHPCFDLSKGDFINNENGDKAGFLIKDYFSENYGKIHRWGHGFMKKNKQLFDIPRFGMPLNKWIKLIVNNGFCIEAAEEPCASNAQIKKNIKFKRTTIVPQILIIRCRKT